MGKYKAGDIVEVIHHVGDDGVVTFPAMVVGDADAKGEAVGLMPLAATIYATVGDEVGQIKAPKSSASSGGDGGGGSGSKRKKAASR